MCLGAAGAKREAHAAEAVRRKGPGRLFFKRRNRHHKRDLSEINKQRGRRNALGGRQGDHVVLVDAIVDAAEGWIGELAGRDERADDGWSSSRSTR